MVAQVNREAVAPMNPNVGMATKKVCDFIRINPLEFYGSMMDVDPHEFIEDIYKIIEIMGISLIEMENLSSHQHKEVLRIWFDQ